MSSFGRRQALEREFCMRTIFGRSLKYGFVATQIAGSGFHSAHCGRRSSWVNCSSMAVYYMVNKVATKCGIIGENA